MFTFAKISQETNTQIEQVATAYEGNPLFSAAINLQKIGYIGSFMVLPSLAMATYYYFRNKVKKGKFDVDNLTFIVNFAFFSLLINIFNDLAILLGKLA